MPSKASPPPVLSHGSANLPLVRVESYNVEIEDAEGFVGDRANRGAFIDLLEQSRKQLRSMGGDPLGDIPTQEIGKKSLDKLLSEGEPEAAALVHAAVEDFAQRLAGTIRRFLRLKAWRDTSVSSSAGAFARAASASWSSAAHRSS